MCRPCYAAYQRDYHRRRTATDGEYRERVRRRARRRAVWSTPACDAVGTAGFEPAILLLPKQAR